MDEDLKKMEKYAQAQSMFDSKLEPCKDCGAMPIMQSLIGGIGEYYAYVCPNKQAGKCFPRADIMKARKKWNEGQKR